jgi:alpha-L-fucosidase
MFVHSNIATVPAFAPVHEYADWYWAFLEPKPDMVLHPTCPLPEVVAWHLEHFGDRPFDDFISDLTYERFDADWYARLLDDAGMRYAVLVTKHHDGFCWWDTAHTDRKFRRDVVAELARAVRARGHIFGCYYSLIDWAHPAYPDQAGYVDAFMRPQIQELIERYDPAVLWGDGHWGHPGSHWRADQIVADARAAGSEVLFNDRFFASHADFVTYEYDVPDDPPDGPWELCRGIGYSFCVNRTEREDDYLDARGIVSLLVETVAKGGNLLLNIGPNADGTLAEIQERVLRRSGAWIREHADAIHGSTRHDVPGGGGRWYTRTGDTVHAFDLTASAEPRFAELHGVARVTTPAGDELPFQSSTGGLAVDARTVERDPLGVRYLVSCVDTPPHRPSIHTGQKIALRLAAARPGHIVELEPGRYDADAFPVVVPAGVTLRGASAATTTIDAGGRHAVVLGGDGAAVENLTITGGAPGYMMIPVTCVTGQGDDLLVRDCRVQSIMLTGGRRHRVLGNVIAGGKVWLVGASDCEVRANFQHGLRWGAGFEVQGGEGNVIVENECRDDLCAVRCVETTGARVERNTYETRWFGIHLLNAHNTLLYRNRAWRTMRAVDIEGGSTNRVEKQLAEHCDTGVVVEGDAQATVVTDSWFHDCRVGALVWAAGPTLFQTVAVSEPRDHELVTDDKASVTWNIS